ncbi:hypothetical protein B0H11DRAFT_119346 [Mycena galericulata]|nr:hypothetical protein B0H11DRAFT_119346 [Mycena galericulata]
MSTVLGARPLEERRQSHKERGSDVLPRQVVPYKPHHTKTVFSDACVCSPSSSATRAPLLQGDSASTFRAHPSPSFLFPNSLARDAGQRRGGPNNHPSTRCAACLRRAESDMTRPACGWWIPMHRDGWSWARSQKTAGKADAHETWPIGGRAAGSYSVVNGMVAAHSIVFPEMLLLQYVR